MRRWFLIAIPLSTLLGLSLWLTSLEPAGVTKANFQRLKEGMTQGEVDTVLGHRSALVTSELFTTFYEDRVVHYSEDRTGLLPANTIRVEFRNDKVISREFHPWTASAWWRRLRARRGRWRLIFSFSHSHYDAVPNIVRHVFLPDSAQDVAKQGIRRCFPLHTVDELFAMVPEQRFQWSSGKQSVFPLGQFPVQDF
jgi:hypothetical protein